jgi:hypothetical protein
MTGPDPVSGAGAPSLHRPGGDRLACGEALAGDEIPWRIQAHRVNPRVARASANHIDNLFNYFRLAL